MSKLSARAGDAPALPSGNVTFLFTDLEDSSAVWERRPSQARIALHFHDRTAEAVAAANNGVLIKHTGDGVKVVFSEPANAVRAAVDMQREFQRDTWDGVERMRVRIGLHSGRSVPDGDDYYGGVINRAARLADAANGDQIAVTGQVVTGTDGQLPPSVQFTDCGYAQLKGVGRERIYLVDATDINVDDRPLRIRRALAGSALPPEGSRLIGRESELQQISSFLDDRRLVSIIGLGGIGKTRLAVAAARQKSNDFADGVVYCPLSAITAEHADADASVLSSLAEALGARRQPGHDMLSSIVNFIEGQEILLVLDNCEHVKASARAVVDRILAVEGPTVMLTSREPLDLPGEQRLALEPLAVESAAVELLVERAVERDAWFSRTEHEDALRQICERLDGIPLALELAAARLRILTPTQLLDGLRDRLQLLDSSSGSQRGRPLFATIAWSVDQLDDRQQAVLEQLCVFAGGFTLSAASAVLGVEDDMQLLDDLTDLVELSLIRNRPGQGEIRFQMLETIRQFGLDRLRERDAASGNVGSADQLHAAHAQYYASLAEDCGQQLMTAAEAEVWTRIDAESDNIRTAFDNLVQAQGYEVAASMVVNLAWFATFSMRMELFTWAQRLLDIPALTDSAELWAVRSIGQYLNADERAVESADTSLDLDITDPTGLARTTLASTGLNNTFDSELSGRATAEMLQWPSDRFAEQRIVARGLRTFHLCLRETNPDAAAIASEALAEAHQTGSASALSIGYWAQTVANLLIDWPTAKDSIEQGLAMCESLTNNHLISHLINGIVVHFSSLTDDVPAAAAITAREIRATMDRHYLVGASHLLGAASVVLVRAGQLDDGAALLGAMISNGHRPRREIRKAVAAALGDRMDDAMSAGRGWTINEAGGRAVDWLDKVATPVG